MITRGPRSSRKRRSRGRAATGDGCGRSIVRSRGCTWSRPTKPAASGAASSAPPHRSTRLAPTVDDATGTVATALDVRAALAQLTDRQRAAVVLRYVADLPLAEIAEVMGCATGTVKATLHQALAHMRIELEADDED